MRLLTRESATSSAPPLRAELPAWLAWLRSFVRGQRLAALGGLVVIGFVLVGLFAPWLAPYDPIAVSLGNALKPPGPEHWMGTDNNGRDVLSRIIYGARVSLTIAIASVGSAALLGVSLGMLAGWYPALEGAFMRFTDVLLAFPGIIFALAIIAILGPGVENVIFAVVITQLPQFARLAHGQTISVKRNAYVEAAIATGVSDGRIMRRYILPNILSPIIVQVSLLIPSAIMTAASLSFIGLGVTPPTPEWGAMLNNSLTWARRAPHVMIFPGLALMLVVFAFNVLGDGLRDALDPRVRKR